MWISPAEMSYLRAMETRALDHLGNAVFFARVVAETCPYATLRETAKAYLDEGLHYRQKAQGALMK